MGPPEGLGPALGVDILLADHAGWPSIRPGPNALHGVLEEPFHALKGILHGQLLGVVSAVTLAVGALHHPGQLRVRCCMRVGNLRTALRGKRAGAP